MAQRNILLDRQRSRRRARQHARAWLQRGFGGFLLLMFVGGLAASVALFTFYRIDTVEAVSIRHTSDVLATTKAALIGYAVQLGERPGELPCPDTNNDGVAEPRCRITNDESHIGRVPWKTLGIPEPKDAAGETLWYAISSEFRNRASFPTSGSINDTNHTLNSDSRGAIVGPRRGSGVLAESGNLPATRERCGRGHFLAGSCAGFTAEPRRRQCEPGAVQRARPDTRA